MQSRGVGIGANTAIFSLIRVVLFKSLPVQDPERLVLMHWFAERMPNGLNQSSADMPRNPAYKAASRSLAYPFFRELSEQVGLFDAVFAFAPLGSDRQNTTLWADGGAERVDGEMVSGGYFRGLGAKPALGRLIAREDERDATHVAVISYAYWTRRFGADPAIVGHAITINNLPFAIAGVAAPGFFGVEPGRTPDVWVPMLDEEALVPWGYRPPEGAVLRQSRDYWWT